MLLTTQWHCVAMCTFATKQSSSIVKMYFFLDTMYPKHRQAESLKLMHLQRHRQLSITHPPEQEHLG